MSLAGHDKLVMDRDAATLCLLGGPFVIKNGRRTRDPRRKQTIASLRDVEWWPSQSTACGGRAMAVRRRPARGWQSPFRPMAAAWSWHRCAACR